MLRMTGRLLFQQPLVSLFWVQFGVGLGLPKNTSYSLFWYVRVILRSINPTTLATVEWRLCRTV